MVDIPSLYVVVPFTHSDVHPRNATRIDGVRRFLVVNHCRTGISPGAMRDFQGVAARAPLRMPTPADLAGRGEDATLAGRAGGGPDSQA